uniref:Transmembrane protein n=1 Tax=Hepeviridae sp. TaxID=2715178 RepID=A0A6M3YPG3_9VIRU|nr:MAG: hypothetical protein [Hepeviridae sp.]QJI53790.1 MAG: hypothetical protein [Hepeviridae sp.]
MYPTAPPVYESLTISPDYPDPHRVNQLVSALKRAKRNLTFALTLLTSITGLVLLCLIASQFLYLKPFTQKLVIMNSDLAQFRSVVLSSITKDQNGAPLTESDWSGFAQITREGGSIVFSASLKTSVNGDPSRVKPAFQKQPLSGFTLQSLEALQALSGDQLIERLQLIYKKIE